MSLIASYGQGALHYSLSTFQLGATAIQSLGGAGWAVGDAAFDNATGRLKPTKHLMVAAGFQHFWTPSLSSTIHGSFRSYDVAFDPVDIRDTHRDARIWTLGANTIWTPVRGLSFALEGAYILTDPKGRCRISTAGRMRRARHRCLQRSGHQLPHTILARECAGASPDHPGVLIGQARLAPSPLAGLSPLASPPSREPIP